MDLAGFAGFVSAHAATRVGLLLATLAVVATLALTARSVADDQEAAGATGRQPPPNSSTPNRPSAWVPSSVATATLTKANVPQPSTL